MGNAGHTGYTGPIGPPGSTSDAFIHIFSSTPQLIGVDEPVNFDSTPVLFGSFAFTNGTSEIWAWQPGYYYVCLTIQHKEAFQFCVMKNDTIVVPGSIFSSPSGSVQNVCSFIMHIDPSEVVLPAPQSPSGVACKVQLRNHTSYFPTIFLDSTSNGSALPNINCNISLILLTSV